MPCRRALLVLLPVLTACSESGPQPLLIEREAGLDGGEQDASSSDTAAPDAEPEADARRDAAADAAGDGAAQSDAGPYWPLGMNDVTILTPLPGDSGAPVLLLASDYADDGTPLLSRALYDLVVAEPVCVETDAGVCDRPWPLELLPPAFYDALHLVALRFDLCDRNLPGTCAAGADGRLRVVYQPLLASSEFFDAALHAFYAIPNARLAAAVGALRALARIQGEPVSSPLKPSPALSAPAKPAYAEGLRAFVREYAGDARLVRLTLNAQPTTLESPQWIMRGVERGPDGSFREPMLLGARGSTQHIELRGGPGYDVSPGTDTPPGLVSALQNAHFNASSEAQQRGVLEALLFAKNPLASAPDTMTCVACHTSTVLFGALAPRSGIDGATLRGRYTTAYDVSIDAGASPARSGTLRALGYTWLQKEPLISTRVVNETAQVLTEIEQRFR